MANILEKDKAITHVLVIHCETSSGILNLLEEIGKTDKTVMTSYVGNNDR